MKPASCSTVNKYKKLLTTRSHVWKKAEINALAKLFNHLGWHGRMAEYNELHDALSIAIQEFGGLSITQEQTNYGKAWLSSKFKLNGELRAKTGFEDHADALKKVTGFKFVGFMVGRNGMQAPCNHTPIYRIKTRAKGYEDGLDYSHIYWGNTYVGHAIEERIGA